MASESIDLTQAWQDACRAFITATGMDLDAPSPTAEQILSKMDKLDEAKEAKNKTTVAKAKAAVGLTLRAVERIGSIVVEGASMTAFGGPASVTFNCISFLIEAGLACEKIADSIEDLFSRIGPIMSRSQLYKDNQSIIGPEMVQLAHRILVAVVKTCEKSIKILKTHQSKRGRVKLFFEVALFSGDGGVQEQLSILESLQQQEGLMGGALTLVTTKAISRDMAAGFEEQKAWTKKTDEAVKDVKMLNELKEKLDISKGIAEKNTADFEARRDKLRPDTCNWLKADKRYGAWSDTSKESPPVMIVQGEEGCGKSYTATSVIRDLMARYPQGREDATRISVAYFYLTCGGQKSALSMFNVLRQWIGQILNNDLIYRKEVSTVIKQNAELGDFNKLLDRLFLSNPGREASFFLVLDGTHELDGKGRKELGDLIRGLASPAAGIPCLRMMLTMNQALLAELSVSSMPIVISQDLKKKNKADLGKYIAAEADNLAIFKSSSSQIAELKSWVVSKLSEASKGSFLVADRTLVEIGNSSAEDEVRDIVARAVDGTVLSDSIEKTIWDCNRSLNPKEIRHLNCLLLWVIFGKWWFQVYDLESILVVQEKRESLQPLHKELKDKFSAFFHLGDEEEDREATVMLKHSSIEDYFDAKSKERKPSGDHSPEALTRGEIIMARHFLEKLCDEYVYKRLGLAAFFDQQLSKTDAGVTVDFENAHAKIAIVCMQAVTGPSSDAGKDVEAYAKDRLVEHLQDIDLETVDADLKAKLGSLLMKMFSDADAFAKFSWAHDDTGVRTVVRLLRNSAVRAGITDTKDAEWVTEIFESDDKSPEIALLEESVSVHERLWFTTTDEEVLMTHFKWLFAFDNKIDNDAGRTARLADPMDDDLTVKVIKSIFRKSKKSRIYQEGFTAAVAARNLGFTYSALSYVPEAISELERALDLVDDDDDDDEVDHHLLTHNLLADNYSRKIEAKSVVPDWEKAMHHKDIVIAGLASGRHWDPDAKAKNEWKDTSSIKADWLRELGRYEESREILENILRDFPDDDGIRGELVMTLHAAGSHEQIIKMLHTLEQELNTEFNKSRLSRLFYHCSEEPHFHSCIVAAFRLAGQLADVDGHYRKAIKDASDNSSEASRTVFCELTYYHASMLNRLGKTVADKDEAIRLWELIVDRARRDSIVETVQILSAKHLARIYTAKAIETGPGSPETKSMLDKVRSFSIDADLEDDESGSFGLSSSVVRSLLGRYFYSIGDVENAKRQLRKDVEVGLKLLADDDPENDYQGYMKLGDAFMNSGDDDNARAAWSLIQPIEEVADDSSWGGVSSSRASSSRSRRSDSSSTKTDSISARTHSVRDGVKSVQDESNSVKDETESVQEKPKSEKDDTFSPKEESHSVPEEITAAKEGSTTAKEEIASVKEQTALAKDDTESAKEENASVKEDAKSTKDGADSVQDDAESVQEETKSVQDEASEVNSASHTGSDAGSVSDKSSANGSDSEAEDTSKIAEPKGPLSYSCDGECGQKWTYADDFYICRECVDICFGQDCLDKFRSGELIRDVCDPCHEFMHVPKWTVEAAERTRNNKVLVGDMEFEITDWLEKIKQKWGLDVDNVELPTPISPFMI